MATKTREDKTLFDDAVDWLLNSRHTADPDIQNVFWGIADGYVTREQVDENEYAALEIAREARRL